MASSVNAGTANYYYSKARAPIRIANARRTRGKCVAAVVVVLDSGLEKCGGTCECGGTRGLRSEGRDRLRGLRAVAAAVTRGYLRNGCSTAAARVDCATGV